MRLLKLSCGSRREIDEATYRGGPNKRPRAMRGQAVHRRVTAAACLLRRIKVKAAKREPRLHHATGAEETPNRTLGDAMKSAIRECSLLLMAVAVWTEPAIARGYLNCLTKK